MKKSNFIELAQVCDLIKGKTGLMKAKAGKYPLVATGKDRRTCDTYQFDTKAVCIPLVSSTGHGHASLKYVHYQEGKFALGTILVAVIPKDENVLNAQFLHLYLSRLKDEILVPLMTGAANVTLTVTKLKTVKVPLPPIEEQLRIVSLFNRMDNEQAELTDEISNQQALLKKFRQSILQEAIEGKLTASWREQNHDVESASILLEKIKAEKEQLIKDKKIKKQKPLSPINKDEIPFDIPESWEWCRTNDICFSISSGSTPSRDTFINNNGIPYLKVYNIRKQKIDLDFKPQFIKQEINDTKLKRSILYPTDIVMNIVGPPLGKIAIIPDDYPQWNCNQAIVHFKLIEPSIHKYLYYFLRELSFLKYIHFKGVAGQDNISVTQSRSILFPLPPLEEQKEIVKKIESLFKICDALETQTNNSKINSEILMQTVLKEAFEK